MRERHKARCIDADAEMSRRLIEDPELRRALVNGELRHPLRRHEHGAR